MPKGGTAAINYAQAPINKKLLKGTKKKPPAPLEGRPTRLAWGDVAKGEYPHMEPTICCTKGCRIHDIILIFPVIKFNEVVEHALVHAGCLRRFLEGVPEEYSVVKERVAAIKEVFVLD